jgi:glycerol kinase
VIRPNVVETTALGAAYLAGLAVGFWKDVAEIQQLWQSEKEFIPAGNPEDIKADIEGWKRAIHAAKSWADKG